MSNYKTYTVKKFDPQVNRMVNCVYRAEENKDKLRKYYLEKLDGEYKK